MFDKIRAISYAFAGAVVIGGLGAAGEFTDTVDWNGLGVFGPTAGMAVGTGIAWGIGYAKKEFSGYGTAESPQVTAEKED